MHCTNFTFQLRLWLEAGSGFSFGLGTARLLSMVQTHGSLRKAAEIMGMSYRRAWGRLKRLEEELGEPLLYKPGGNKRGYRLTALAEELVDGYARWHESVARYAEEQACACLPRGVAPSENSGEAPRLDPPTTEDTGI